MPIGFQPPKFRQFNDKRNPRQHTTHLMEICSNIGTKGDLLVKQLVISLKGNTFDWYIDLEPNFIYNWEQLEREFLNHFYSTWHIVSMTELTNTCQWKDELVIDYINRWRNLSLDCRDKLTKALDIKMCTQGMHLGYALYFSRDKTKNLWRIVDKSTWHGA